MITFPGFPGCLTGVGVGMQRLRDYFSGLPDRWLGLVWFGLLVCKGCVIFPGFPGCLTGAVSQRSASASLLMAQSPKRPLNSVNDKLSKNIQLQFLLLGIFPRIKPQNPHDKVIDEYGSEGAGCATLDILAEEGLYR